MSYNCESCKYTTPYKTHFDKHLKTNKHEKKQKSEIEIKFICKYCNKNYKHKQSLSKHISLCNNSPKDKDTIHELQKKLKIYETNNKILNEQLCQQIELFKEMQHFMNDTFNKIFQINIEKIKF